MRREASLERLAFARVNPPRNALEASSIQAFALRYLHDATRVGKGTYPKQAAGGWCNAWAKRA